MHFTWALPCCRILPINNLQSEKRQEMMHLVKKDQKTALREGKKIKRKLAADPKKSRHQKIKLPNFGVDDKTQTRLVQFGIGVSRRAKEKQVITIVHTILLLFYFLCYAPLVRRYLLTL